jgi:hypothetical protein
MKNDYRAKADYMAKGGFANMLKFRLDSTKWTPSNPGCLGFDASIDTCSDPEATKIGSRPLIYDLMWEGEGRSFIGPWDSLRFDKPAVITGIARLDPSFDVAKVAKAEGIEFSEPELAEVRRTEIPIDPMKDAEKQEIIDRAKELLTVPEVREAITELANEELRNRGVPLTMPSVPYYAKTVGRAIAIKELLGVAAMPNASAKVREFCLAVADKIASQDIDLPEG